MIAEVVVVVAGKEREDETTPQFPEVTWDIVAELPDAVREQRVCGLIALGQCQQSRCGNERNTVSAHAIKSGDDRDTMSANRHEPMFRDLNSRLCRKGKRENFTCGNVSRIIRLGKLSWPFERNGAKNDSR